MRKFSCLLQVFGSVTAFRVLQAFTIPGAAPHTDLSPRFLVSKEGLASLIDVFLLFCFCFRLLSFNRYLSPTTGHRTLMKKNPSNLFRADRYRSWARHHAAEHTSIHGDSKGDTILPSLSEKTSDTTETGGLDGKKYGRGSPSGSTANKQGGGVVVRGSNTAGGGAGDYFGDTEASTRNDAEGSISQAAPSPAPPPHKSEDAGAGNSAIESADGNIGKPPISTRMLNGSKRFLVHMKNALFHSWVNVLLIFVPIGIIAEGVGLSPGIIFGMNAIAIIPLAGLLAYATESVAIRLGDTLGALLNVSFGNAVELIIFIIALVKNEIQIVQASLLGSILANLLLILGMAFLFGGLRYREQIYNSTVTQMSACLLSLSVMSLLLPVSF